MPDTPENVSETEEKSTASPKKSKKLLMIILAALLVLGGGGGGYFFFFRAKASAGDKSKEKNAKKKPNKEAEEAPSEDEASTEKAGKDGANGKTSSKDLLKMSLPDDSEVKRVVELQPFIVNLADDSVPRYLRMTVNVGLGEGSGGGETKPDTLFTTKVRNAMLAVLTSKRSEEILTIEGKAMLRKELLRAAQAAVSEPEIHAIYITDFIVQL